MEAFFRNVTKFSVSFFRKISISVPDLSVQLDVFDEQRECDESQSLQGPDGINLNSHLDIFYAILRQVSVMLLSTLCDKRVL